MTAVKKPRQKGLFKRGVVQNTKKHGEVIARIEMIGTKKIIMHYPVSKGKGS